VNRRLWISLVGIVLISTGLLIGNLVTGNTPILGLDLQGGVSVILAPVDDDVSEDDLEIVRDLVRDELESAGVAEPDVRVQGDTIVVELPGVRDQQEALERVQVSGVVELRPVLPFAACPLPEDPETTESTEVDEEEIDFTVPGAEILPSRDGQVLCVGPVQGTGEVFERGSAELQAQEGWSVSVDLRGDGEATWNALASQCYSGAATCPPVSDASRGQIAIVLDGVVQSAPVVNVPAFDTGVSITGDFTRGEAEDLRDVLNRGAFPFEVEPQEARTVSASAGSDSLQAAVVAGLIGVVLVLIFLLFYYRAIALVVMSGLVIWGMTVFSVASLVSGWTNYALSLAGITGIIVAVGVTVDSYVVFFERMKDEIRNGRTLRNAAPRSFKVTWRTIWSADLVSIIGAAILFWLSVGSVRGFALYLGITTICDLIVCFFFTRPAVLLLSRSNFMRGRRAFGLEVAQ